MSDFGGLTEAQRAALLRTVTALRRLLQEDLYRRLEGEFGVHSDGLIEPLDALPNLAALVERLEAVTRLSLNPSLDDGVLLNAAPYHELLSWPEAARAWEDLRAGKYPWARLVPQVRPRKIPGERE